MGGIVEIDLHGSSGLEAKNKIDRVLEKANSATYRIRLIHGYHGGNIIKNMIGEEYGFGRHAKVIRIQPGVNPGITELILREY